MILVDANILLHAVNRDSPLCSSAGRSLEELANGSSTWGLSWGIVYEFMRVATHPRIFPSPLSAGEAWTFVQELILRPSCLVLGETGLHAELMAECLKESPRLRGNILHDLHTAVLMREHGVREILTLDRDFRSFSWVKTVALDSD
jgi:uncharacterized protein